MTYLFYDMLSNKKIFNTLIETIKLADKGKFYS